MTTKEMNNKPNQVPEIDEEIKNILYHNQKVTYIGRLSDSIIPDNKTWITIGDRLYVFDFSSSTKKLLLLNNKYIINELKRIYDIRKGMTKNMLLHIKSRIDELESELNQLKEKGE